MTEKDLDGRVVLITGASRGIGDAAATECRRRGAHVIAVARTVGGLEELDDDIQAMGGTTTLVPLDLADYAGIDRLGAAIHERWGRLDGLIGNAGLLGAMSPVSHIEPKDFDKAFAINVTANYRLIRSMDLLLRQSDAGRAVFVSSGAANSAARFGGFMPPARRRSTRWSKPMPARWRIRPSGPMFSIPAPSRTQMRAKAMPGEDPETLPTPADIAPALVDMIAPSHTGNGEYYDYPKEARAPALAGAYPFPRGWVPSPVRLLPPTASGRPARQVSPRPSA